MLFLMNVQQVNYCYDDTAITWESRRLPDVSVAARPTLISNIIDTIGYVLIFGNVSCVKTLN